MDCGLSIVICNILFIKTIRLKKSGEITVGRSKEGGLKGLQKVGHRLLSKEHNFHFATFRM
jgi:hypothetical protein